MENIMLLSQCFWKLDLVQCREIHYTNTLTYLFMHVSSCLKQAGMAMPSCILEVTNLALRDHAARRTYMVTQHYSDTRRDTRPDISLRHSQSGSNTRMSSTKTLPDASDIRDHDTTVNPPVATSATPPSDIRSTTATRTPIMNAVCRRKETY